MRVLMGLVFYPRGGSAQVVRYLSNALRERGHEMALVTSHHNYDLPDEDEYEGIPVHRLPFRRALTSADPGLMMETRRRLSRLLHEYKPGLIHVSNVMPSTVFYLHCAEETGAALLVSLITGLLSGVLPARRAASLDPVEALHTD